MVTRPNTRDRVYDSYYVYGDAPPRRVPPAS